MSNRKNGVSFEQALDRMRSTAQAGVQDAIYEAHASVASPGKRPRRAAGRAAQALFDGVLEAVAELITSVATEGRAGELCELVCCTLRTKVARRARARLC
jgi:hypothetical protein